MPRTLPLADLACRSDSDCEISTYNLDNCRGDPDEEPYPVSREALQRYVDLAHTRPAPEGHSCDTEEWDRGGCATSLADWVAVCSDHICRKRKAHFFSSPKVHCPGGS